MSNFRPTRPTSSPEWRPRTHVSFRITLPPSTYASTIDVVGSWDNFSTAMPLEQDRRVGRDVWKAILTLNGGLEMGSEHFYYFLLDRKNVMPDPQSLPSSLAVHPRTGRLMSTLFVPVELPPTPEPAVKFAQQQQVERSDTPVSSMGTIGSSVFADFDGDGDDTFMQAFVQPNPQQPRHIENNNNSGRKGNTFRERLRARRSSLASPGQEEEQPKPKRRRGWGLQLSVSTALLRMGYRTPASDGLESKEDLQSPPRRDEDAIADIVGYLRSNDAATPKASQYILPMPTTHPHSTASSVYSQNPDRPSLSPSPGMYSSFYSSEDDEDELATPVDVAFPKYYNFDELKGADAGLVQVPSLECLREQVVGEMAWQREIVGEHGYLGSVVV
ncbi:hypothetical protein BZA05DRAFT_442834 [Tricharina praecox]|uniref:uncharacterized protein n=1 Tax=Tricharina praecox TaxID=43433 RepID=UPI00221FFA03|nr:uncharacterized protein BZA05DRAFT_442834 [Tricharina praecox]KAI5855173.1 hypothetical protein BZA05DRAFT_442834 [Tricharina praecox]